MVNIAYLIIGIIIYITTWSISSSIKYNELKSKEICYCVNILFTLSTILLLLSFVFENTVPYSIISFIILFLYIVVLLVLIVILNIDYLYKIFLTVIPSLLFILILIYTKFSITKTIGIVSILFGLYFSILYLVYYLIYNEKNTYNILLILCGVSLIIFGVFAVTYKRNIEYTKLKTS
jgi:hypothetical protein